MGLHVCPPFITLYGHVICNGAVDVRGLMLTILCLVVPLSGGVDTQP